MKSPIAQWRLGYDTPDGERVQITAGAFDELVIPAAGIHIEVMHDGTDPDDEGWACLDVHIGDLHMHVSVDAAGKRIIRRIDGECVKRMRKAGIEPALVSREELGAPVSNPRRK